MAKFCESTDSDCDIKIPRGRVLSRRVLSRRLANKHRTGDQPDEAEDRNATKRRIELRKLWHEMTG